MIKPAGKILAVAFVLGSLSGLCQQPVLYFKRLNHANGLSHNKVNCILQDLRGFTWIGTDDGLNRYDGHNFLVFKNIPGQPSSVSGNTITDLHEDKDGILWIATADGGLSRYDYRLSPDQQFRQFKHHPGDSNSIPVNIVNALKEDKNGHLWLATSGSAVLRFDKKNEKFVKPQGINVWTIYDMCFDKTGIIWAGREGGSILKVNPYSLQWEIDPRYSNLYVNLPHVVVTRLFRDSRGHIWFGSWDKAIYRQNAVTGMEESFINQSHDPYSFGIDEPIAFNEDRQGRIWIGGKNYGLYIHDPQTGRFYNYRHDPSREGTLSDNRVNCIFIDRSGLVWLGTNNGISLYNGRQGQFEQQFLPAQPGDKPLVIYDFYREMQGKLWIATNKGLFLEEGDGFRLQKLNYKGSQLSITKIFRDSDGKVYLGTDYTLFSYDPRSGKIAVLPGTEQDQVMSKLIESRIVSIAKDTVDGHPVLWTAPYGHFFTYYDFTEQRWVSRKDSVKNILQRYAITDNLIRKIARTRDGSIWLGNAKNGLIRLDKTKGGSARYINNPALKNSISNNHVYDFIEDEKGNFWISTYGGGLNYFDSRKKEFLHYSSMHNLLEGLAIDKKGNVWTVSNGHLQKFDPRSKTFTYFEIPDVEKTGGIKGSIYQDEEGKFYVAGAGYFVAFEPERITAERRQPQVYFTDLSIFNQSYSHLLSRKQISLRHNQNFFTIHFSAPHYTGPAPVQYSYMLEGVDPDWVDAGSLSQAPYTNLSGGEYTFKVRASTTPGSWSEQVATLGIRIIPPVWKRGWFFVLLFVLLASLIYIAYRYRINELLKRQAIRNKIAQDLHDNVGSTLSSISVYSQVAKIYKQKDRQEELQTTLEKISHISGEMISDMNDIVWAINPRNDNMDKILQRMESFAKPLLASQGIQFHFSFDPAINQLHLEMSKRKNFYLIFKEAINNALKYSGAPHLWVEIGYQQQLIVMSIRDEGKGFDMTQLKVDTSASLSGNGLQNLKTRAKEMNGDIRIESGPGKGTRITLRFPIP